MRCECCNNLLSDVDSTAKFVESGNYVNMCQECRGFLPRDILISTRTDLERKDREAEDSDFDNEGDVDDNDEDRT